MLLSKQDQSDWYFLVLGYVVVSAELSRISPMVLMWVGANLNLEWIPLTTHV